MSLLPKHLAGRAALAAGTAAACAAALLVLGGGPATAASDGPPVTMGSTYLSLGDSVTFGYRESDSTPTPPNYLDAASFVGYPEVLGSELGLNVVNPSCPGETSASFINDTAQSNGCENSVGGGPGYRTLFPLHVAYKESQLDFAVGYLRNHPNTRLVSLMIGANDLFVCEETTSDGCAGELGTVAATITKNVHTILSAIRNRAHYEGQLVILNYYSLDYTSATDNGASALLNSAMDTAAKPFDAAIADGFGELQTAAMNADGSTCEAGLLTEVASPDAGATDCAGHVHPSYAGQSLLAQAVLKVTRLAG